MMAERGVVLSYESVREWCLKFGATYAKQIRAHGPRPGDRWHLDEVFLKIQGKLQYLWRAVDQDGDVLDILVQSRRNKRAAKKFFRKLLKVLHYVPRVIVTDKLRSYAAAKAEILPSVQHEQHTGLNIRAENFHQPTRTRAAYAGLQVARTGATLSLDLWGDRLVFPSWPASSSGCELPRDYASTLHAVA